ncbi:uncharacterized protein LOC142982869 [Anticarsia gemmatalis]|uniref:uncharacterized protein LOC142982869 n=1 Tax=Anticarsia gemmatalis TaxID=129554 RepID=UPI003F76EA9B
MNENDSDASNSLSEETHAFELQFIKTYEQHPVLWNVNHSDYSNKYRRGVATDVLVKVMKKWNKAATRYTVRRKINALRSSYRKDLRKHLSSKTTGPGGEITYEYTPKNWKYYALSFLGRKIDEECESMKTKGFMEVDLDITKFDEEVSQCCEESETEEIAEIQEIESDSIDVLETYREKRIEVTSQPDAERSQKNRVIANVNNTIFDSSVHDKEFDAIGSNVACKLKRMNSEQRCHAELLINKVLIEGLKNNLTEFTDLTEIYK